jgi:hypothetical protein
MDINITITVDSSLFTTFSKMLGSIEGKLDTIINKENTMAKTLADIDTVITAFGPVLVNLQTTLTNDDSIISQIATAVAALEAAQSGGGDTTTEVAALSALFAQAQTMQAQATTQTAALSTVLKNAGVTPPADPVISSALTLSAPLAGPAVSYQITASGSPTGFAATGLPAGLAIDPTTGIISGTPTAAGVSNVTISATNAGGSGTATLVITAA